MAKTATYKAYTIKSFPLGSKTETGWSWSLIALWGLLIALMVLMIMAAGIIRYMLQ